MSLPEFAIDSRAKYGDADWDDAGEDGNDFTSFVDALNRGVTVRGAGLPGESGAPADISVDAASLDELRAIFSRYS